MNISVLGAGMVGRAIALDLARHFTVTSFDVHQQHLDLLQQKNPTINTQLADLQKHSLYEDLLKPFDLVVMAVPGFMGFSTLRQVILCGKNVIDISFFPEDAHHLHHLAVENNVTAIVDCGVAPGMSNLILGRYNEEMQVSNFEAYVGGLPKIRTKPFEYKAPFSPVDVIQEYIRPARLKENGNIIIKPALSDCEHLQFDEVGTLEAFNTDGLRSLLFSFPNIPDMKEKTMRYPGHAQLITGLKEAGFFNEEPISFHGKEISPLHFSSHILVKQWKLGETEKELTVMRVIVEGHVGKDVHRVEYHLFDEYDEATQTSSMARTTGYTCTAAVHLLHQNMFTAKGVFPPEFIGKDKACFDFMMQHLKERGVNWVKS
ncbi:MAG: saccharopine dehydrogenase NADP-binding domain-containing protein [Chitinophagaceae bacterium]|nr:saccharopine dehydrogenase NADP-binding domain-containing protein [Chitinophagaceae bacterium]